MQPSKGIFPLPDINSPKDSLRFFIAGSTESVWELVLFYLQPLEAMVWLSLFQILFVIVVAVATAVWILEDGALVTTMTNVALWCAGVMLDQGDEVLRPTHQFLRRFVTTLLSFWLLLTFVVMNHYK